MLKQSQLTLCGENGCRLPFGHSGKNHNPYHSLAELIDADLKVGILTEEGIETFGWISSDYEMIRSPMGAVWIQLSRDMDGDELTPPSLGEDDAGGIAGASTLLPTDEEEEEASQDTNQVENA